MFKDILFKREMNFCKPNFIHTSPNQNVRTICDRIQKGLSDAKYIIRITSSFVDMLYEDILGLANKNPLLTIKVITRPKKDYNKGLRVRIGTNALDILNKASKGNLKTSEVVHSRMVIIDEQELIISSADLTRDQLYDEYNAGIFTNDKEAIKKAIEYFENVWNQSDLL